MASSKTAQIDPRVKKLKIQTGVVKRLAKEKTAYDKEIAETQKKIEKMMHEGMSTFLVEKQEETKQESEQMVPLVLRKLKTAFDELETLMQECAGDMAETENYQTAQTAMESAKQVLDQGSSGTSNGTSAGTSNGTSNGTSSVTPAN